MDDTPRITELRKKLEKDPGSRLFAQLAEELRKAGRPDEAIEVAREGLDKNPNYPSARLTLARALVDASRHAEARPELEQIVRAAPDNILATRLLAEVLDALGDTGAALKQFEQTALLAPSDKAVEGKVEELKARMSAPIARPAGGHAGTAPAPSAEAAEELPSAFPEVAAPPSVEVPLPSVPEPAAAELPSIPEPPDLPSVEVPEAPAVAVALDRDLASGTFSPGTLKADDIQKHFDEVAAAEAPPVPTPSAPADLDDTVGFGELKPASEPEAPPRIPTETVALPAVSAPPPAVPNTETIAAMPAVQVPELPELPAVEMPEELPAVEMPADNSDVGATTLPLNSVTLADLYLQQGLKAEASAVLAQVMKDEPENKEARSRLEKVSSELAEGQAPAESEVSAPAEPAAPAERTAPAAPSRREDPAETIAALSAFLVAVEREALQQKATGKGAS